MVDAFDEEDDDEFDDEDSVEEDVLSLAKSGDRQQTESENDSKEQEVEEIKKSEEAKDKSEPEEEFDSKTPAIKHMKIDTKEVHLPRDESPLIRPIRVLDTPSKSETPMTKDQPKSSTFKGNGTKFTYLPP